MDGEELRWAFGMQHDEPLQCIQARLVVLVQQMLLEGMGRRKIVQSSANTTTNGTGVANAFCSVRCRRILVRQEPLHGREELLVRPDRSRLDRRSWMRQARQDRGYEPRRKRHDHRWHNMKELGDPFECRRLDFLVLILYLLKQNLQDGIVLDAHAATVHPH